MKKIHNAVSPLAEVVAFLYQVVDLYIAGNLESKVSNKEEACC